MKRIYFDNQGTLKSNALMIGFLFIMVFGFFNRIYGFGVETIWDNPLLGFGFVLFSLHFLNKVLRKNYIGWNKLGIIIRINKFILEKRIAFNEIKSFKLENGFLTIEQYDSTKKIDLSTIDENDVEKLMNILKTHTAARTA